MGKEDSSTCQWAQVLGKGRRDEAGRAAVKAVFQAYLNVLDQALSLASSSASS